MSLISGFDASQVEPSVPFEVLPAGTYDAIITGAEEKDTKDGQGKYVNLTIDVKRPDGKMAKYLEKLNLENKSTVAVEIARATLSSICRAVGVLRPRDYPDLFNIRFRLTLGLKKRTDQPNEMQNVAKKWEPRSAATAPAPQPAATPPSTERQVAAPVAEPSPWDN